jgi:hypothetical protein
MRDPIDELENFTNPGLTMNQLPASEVRRRGTRMRRRNNALAAIGGVAAVAIIATPIAMAATGTNSGSRDPDPAKTASETPVVWVSEIPTDFPLTAGMPTRNGHDNSPVTARPTYESQAPEVCEGAGWTDTGATDVSQAIYTGESEGGVSHAVAVYPTDREAGLTFMSLTTKIQACAVQTTDKNRRVEVLGSGDPDSLVYADIYSDAGDHEAVQLVRVGNAIFEATTYGNGVPAQQTADALVKDAAPVVDAMCVFSADPC